MEVRLRFPELILKMLNVCPYTNSIGGKAAIPGINTKDVECLPIYSNESPYVKKFGEIVLPFIKTILSNSLENAKQAKVRDTLLPKLMSGELKINEIETEK